MGYQSRTESRSDTDKNIAAPYELGVIYWRYVARRDQLEDANRAEEKPRYSGLACCDFT